MSFKSRSEPAEVTILRSLNNRMILAEKDKKRYYTLEKGYEGELMFDALTEKLQSHSLILNDLRLESNKSKFQLDSSIVFQAKINLFEVKNYEGDYYYENGKFYTLFKKEIQNPLHQLEREETLLREVLHNIGIKIPIESYVVFINPAFFLYQAPLNKPIIYSNQLPLFMKNLNMQPSNLNTWHMKLAEKLVSLHQTELPYDRLPPYEYGRLRKGTTCKRCNSFSVSVKGYKIVCGTCGCEEEVASAVIRGVEEINLLFPNIKITTNLVHEWCKIFESKKAIRRVLKQNYCFVGRKEFGFTHLND
ncbi:NERD domain-containing protein [Neobacillus drentensis]|uniref:NERD domain-containing protein n=1 Tax=Neobacillus drentensis TaxID=220684 RepID=UPI0030030275